MERSEVVKITNNFLIEEIEVEENILTEDAKLKEDLKRIDKQMSTQRKNRGQMVRVGLVGYTNVGK